MRQFLARHALQYVLIQLITLELICIAVILLVINWILNVHLIVGLLVFSIVAATANIYFMKRTRHVIISGHIITLLCLLTIALSNLWLGGLQTSYVIWFLTMPVIAAGAIGGSGLLIYTSVVILFIIGFDAVHWQPIIAMPENVSLVMRVVNVIFPLLIIATVMHTLLKSYYGYEKMLKKHNIALRDQKHKYRYLSRYDSLTNLPNRAYFHAQLDLLLNAKSIQFQPFTLLFMDLDGLKKVNDTLGHEAGDTLLMLSSKRLTSCLRRGDTLARLGGDEFTAIIHHDGKGKYPDKIISRILEAFRKPFNLNGTKVYSTISVGMASYPQDGKTADVLFSCADKALYEVKRGGGNASKHYTPDLVQEETM